MPTQTIKIPFAHVGCLAVLGWALFACAAPPAPEQRAATASHLDEGDDPAAGESGSGAADRPDWTADDQPGNASNPVTRNAPDDRDVPTDPTPTDPTPTDPTPTDPNAPSGGAEPQQRGNPPGPFSPDTLPADQVVPPGTDPNALFVSCGQYGCWRCDQGQCHVGCRNGC
jgi:hypothetical protein